MPSFCGTTPPARDARADLKRGSQMRRGLKFVGWLVGAIAVLSIYPLVKFVLREEMACVMMESYVKDHYEGRGVQRRVVRPEQCEEHIVETASSKIYSSEGLVRFLDYDRRVEWLAIVYRHGFQRWDLCGLWIGGQLQPDGSENQCYTIAKKADEKARATGFRNFK